jgi:nucleoporin SEH1
VSRISWAHPEFGSIIASSSFDRTVKIWEQTSRSAQAENPQVSLNDVAGMQHPGQTTSTTRWAEKASLVDARGTVRAVEFAPHDFGLKLVCNCYYYYFFTFPLSIWLLFQASISSDNYLRVYECLEQPSLKTWHLSEDIDLEALASSSFVTHGNTVALATPTQTSGLTGGAPAPLVAQALQQSQNSIQNSQLRPAVDHREADGGWCLSWCKDRYWGEIIAAGCGISGVIKAI